MPEGGGFCNDAAPVRALREAARGRRASLLWRCDACWGVGERVLQELGEEVGGVGLDWAGGDEARGGGRPEGWGWGVL